MNVNFLLLYCIRKPQIELKILPCAEKTESFSALQM